MKYGLVKINIYTDPFDEWFGETRGTSEDIEVEVDDCEYDSMDADIDEW